MDESTVLVPIKRGNHGGDEASHRGISLYTSIAIIWSAWFGFLRHQTPPHQVILPCLHKFETGIQDLNFKWKSFDEYLYPGTLRQVQTVLCHPSVSLSRGDNNYLLIGPCFKVYFCTYITLILEMPGCVYNTDFDF